MLAAAEVADIGVHIRTNITDSTTAEGVRLAIRAGRVPAGYIFELFDPVRASSAFRDHENVLDAIVWSVEEANRALTHMLRGQGGGRVRLTEAQVASHRDKRREAAASALERYSVCKDELLEACKFLAKRWGVWDSEGREFTSQAYRSYLAAAVRMLQTSRKMDLNDIATAVGYQSNHTTPTLRVIWPDWAEEQKVRLIRTLRPTADSKDARTLSLDEIRAFADFVEKGYQDVIFLRLESFEAYAFEDLEMSMAGMLSDIQGMAVAVEHAVRAMGGTRTQIFQMFRQLWSDPHVSRLLQKHKQLAEQKVALSQWSQFKTKIDDLRNAGAAGAIAGDLIMAHRLRASVHHALPEDGQFELEMLFVNLLRAAATTHAHVARTKAEKLT